MTSVTTGAFFNSSVFTPQAFNAMPPHMQTEALLLAVEFGMAPDVLAASIDLPTGATRAIMRSRHGHAVASSSDAAIAGAEGFRPDSFYFAAGDIGNLCGPADPDSAFTHPTLKSEDKNGRARAVRVQGPEPKPGIGPGDAVHLPDHVTALVLVADGDSEPYFTASAMARAEKLHSRAGRAVETWWPPEGGDFADLMTG